MSDEKPILDESQPTLGPRNLVLERFLWGLLIAILVGVCGASVFRLRSVGRGEARAVWQPVEPSPSDGYGSVPDFSLIDQTGKTVTPAELKGQVWVADFFFTHCPGRCPLMTKRMGTLQSALPEGGDARLVSITVDPERDSPEVLAEYAEQFGAKDDRWLFLTGDKKAIIELAREGFHLPASEDPNDHSLRLALVDRAGRIRGYFDSMDDESLAELRQRLQQLLREEP